MKNILKIGVFSNIFIAFIAFLLSLETNYIIGVPNDYKSPIFVFFSTLFIYNLGYYQAVLFDDLGQREASKWMKENRSYWIFSMLISLIVIAYIFSSYTLIVQLTILILTGISIAYVLHTVNLLGFQFSIRNIPMLKTMIVSAIWSLVTILPQVMDNELYENSVYLLLLAERFFFILPITLMFDIRDHKSDPLALKTFPKIIGIFNTKVMAIFSLILAYVFLMQIDIANSIKLSMVIVYLLMLVTIIKSSDQRNELYYSAWFDGLMGIHALLVLSFYWA